MWNLTIKREKKFAAAMVPYWIIKGISKEEFCRNYNLNGDACPMGAAGFALARIDLEVIKTMGQPIGNGQTIELLMDDNDKSLFAITMDGYLSNEIIFDEYLSRNPYVLITTKGGFKTLPHPVIIDCK